MAVLMFKDFLAPKVEDGSKRHTVRPRRKRPIKPGDSLSLRRWAGKAYRSKQITLREAVCKAVKPIRVTVNKQLYIDGQRVPRADADKFARADGLSAFWELADFLRKEHGLPFEGEVISW